MCVFFVSQNIHEFADSVARRLLDVAAKHSQHRVGKTPRSPAHEVDGGSGEAQLMEEGERSKSQVSRLHVKPQLKSQPPSTRNQDSEGFLPDPKH